MKNNSKDNLGLTEFLLNNDIDVNNSINMENSLFYAVENKMKDNNQILSILFPYIQDINQQNFERKTVLMRACQNKPTAIETIMEKKPNINIQNKTGETAAIIGCCFCPKKLNIILQNADLQHFNIENSNGENIFDVSELYGEPIQSIVKNCWENINIKFHFLKNKKQVNKKIL